MVKCSKCSFEYDDTINQCPSCGSVNKFGSAIFNLIISTEVEFHGQSNDKTIHNRPMKSFEQKYDFNYDLQVRTIASRVFDRRIDWYDEYILNAKTRSPIHECHCKLTDKNKYKIK